MIENREQLQNVLKETKIDVTEDKKRFDHASIASQAIKVVNSMKLDPFVKKVMTLRMMSPIVTGRERTHLSIALELGCSVDEVKQAEQYGVKCVELFLQKCELPEFIEKFNREKAVRHAVEGMSVN